MLPDGWDLYDPNNHERSDDPEYTEARKKAAARAATRRLTEGDDEDRAMFPELAATLDAKTEAFFLGAGSGA